MSTLPPPAPSIEPDDLPAEQPSWPKVVGIISICVGALFMCCGGFGLASPLLMNMMPPEQRSQFPPSMMSGLQTALIAAGMLSDVLLIVAGALTISRKPAGRVLHLAFAVIAILITIGATFAGFQQQAVIDQWVRENPSSQFAQQQKMAGGMGQWFGLGIGLVLGLAYPIFLFIWFGLVKRTAASMGTSERADYI
ncbi:MAG: hypothetical protein GIKADHBN_03641 [Phycisphaerales bacterium]|nr:hypothetical protein [Phycisphaerales bacterium]